jgi:hypothetical protein
METKMMIIIAVVVCVLLISSSLSSYFFMSSGEEKSTSTDSQKTESPGVGESVSQNLVKTETPTINPSPPTTNWSGNAFTSDGRCGPQFGNKACNGKQCCSQFGWCGGQKGQNDDWCGKFKAFDGKFDGEKP